MRPVDKTLVVHEIYRSIQGESSRAGIPCTFVRLTGCNLRCTWCDTEHAFSGGQRMPVDQVIEQVDGLGGGMVEVTGGEPLLQAATCELLCALCDRGYEVLLETSGERDVSPVDKRVRKIMDVKAPGSGESQRNRLSNLDQLSAHDEIKFVLADRRDYDWMCALVRREALEDRVGEVLLSCVHGVLDPKDLVAWVLADGLNVRVQLQLHKYIWGPDARAV